MDYMDWRDELEDGWLHLIWRFAFWVGVIALLAFMVVWAFNAKAEPVGVVEVNHADPASIRAFMTGMGWEYIPIPSEMPQQMRAEIVHRQSIACALSAEQVGVDPARVLAVGLFRRPDWEPGRHTLLCTDTGGWALDYTEQWCGVFGWKLHSYEHPVIRCATGVGSKPSLFRQAKDSADAESDFHWKGRT